MIEIWDITGDEDIWPFWQMFCNDTDAIIYVIDSEDIKRMDLALKELNRVTDFGNINRKIPYLILVSKQDK